MSFVHITLLVVVLVIVLWQGRRLPFAGWRRYTVLGCRLIAISLLWAALSGAAHRRIETLPRYVIYAADVSASIDGAQREWMARRIASLESLRPRQVDRAVIAFGRDARLIHPFGKEPLADPDAIQQVLERADVGADETNIEAALLEAVALLPPDRRGSLILLSDGQETSGSALDILAPLRRFGLQIVPTPPPLFGAAKTVWDELAVPPVVQRGSPVSIQCVVHNGASRPKRGQLTIALQGVVIKRQRVAVRPGWQVLSASVPALQRGTMELDVRLAIPDDGLDEQRRAYTEVEGPPRLLLVSDRPGTLPPLAAALKRREMDVSTVRPDELPTDATALLDDDAVLLFNLPKSSLTSDQVAALQTYVEQFGGGVVMVGLGGDLATEVTTASPLDALLPVQFEPKGLQEAKRRVCMILLIDRSASMVGPRIAATKRAAVALVKQLAPEDLVGVLAFDTQPYVVVEVQPASQVGSWLVEKLVKLRSSGGTDVYPALIAASHRLELTGATLKHIILLSDGNTPVDENTYDALLESFRLSGTSISTVGIGSAFVNVDYLRWLAQSTGGTFYQLRSLDELPQLVARDAEQALGRLPFTEGFFRPTKSPTSDWFPEVSDWPALRGFLTATAKPGAQTDLTIATGESDQPLLARWSVGRGRVVSFTSDADTRWSPEWVRWPGFEGAWAQVMRWAMRPRLTEELFVWLDESRSPPQLVVEANLQEPRGQLIASEDAAVVPLSLVQTGDWRWQASLEQVPSGWYQLALEASLPHASSAPVFAKRWIRLGTARASREMTGQPPREAFLRQLARATSGAYDVPDQALLPPTTTVTTTVPLFTWWLPLVILLFLVDIALRGSSML